MAPGESLKRNRQVVFDSETHAAIWGDGGFLTETGNADGKAPAGVMYPVPEQEAPIREEEIWHQASL